MKKIRARNGLFEISGNGDEDNEHELDAKMDGDDGRFAQAIYDGGDEMIDDVSFRELEQNQLQQQGQYTEPLGDESNLQV